MLSCGVQSVCVGGIPLASPTSGLARKGWGLHRPSLHAGKMEKPHQCGFSPCLQGANRARSSHVEGL